jgi:hypothetical protein
MSSIYQNAVLTLAATRALNDDAGFLGLTKASPTQEILFETSKGLEKLCVRLAPLHLAPLYLEYSQNYWKSADRHNPLLERGWVYQERLLSRRVLHFGHSELRWECLEDTACECTRTSTVMNGNATSKRTLKQNHHKAISDPCKLSMRWHEIVTEYTKLSLTYEKDISPALSGIAR